MNDLYMLSAMQEMLYYTVIAVCAITVPILIIGVVISILQAATQINEMTITFIPKFVTMFGLMFMLGPWLLNKLVIIAQNFLTHLPQYIR